MADDFGPFAPEDGGTAALIQHWKRSREQQIIAATGSASGRSLVLGVGEAVRTETPPAELNATGHAPTVVVSLPEVLLGAELVTKGTKTEEGDIVVAVTPVFRRFLRELDRDPSALYQLDPRQFEELIAGAYDEAGCEHVVLTPRSGDRGRDVIATSKAFGTIRIVDQVKLYAPNRVVDADDVRALYGVLSLDHNASKGIVTTTSTFAPGVYSEFARAIPARLSLRNGTELREWLYLFDKS
jgi:restriction system protein